MYILGQTLLDKAGSPYFPEDQFDELARIAYNDWIEMEYRKFEQGQEHTARIRNLYKTFTKPNANTIAIAAEIPDFRYLVRFKSKYRFSCKGKVSYPEPPIIKAQNDDIDMLIQDPLNSPTNAEPLYIFTEENGVSTIKVYAETVPLELSMTYIRTGQSIDSANSPNTVFEQPDYIAEEIVQLVVKKMDVVIENPQKTVADANEIRQRLN